MKALTIISLGRVRYRDDPIRCSDGTGLLHLDLRNEVAPVSRMVELTSVHYNGVDGLGNG